MSKTYIERRVVRQGAFEYRVDDDDLTAWISKGYSGGAEVYTLPEQVEIDSKTYRLTSVEIGAFCSKQERIRELFIPDCYEYIDEVSFKIDSLKTVHIGKGLQQYHPWSFTSNLETLTIHPDNPFLKISIDGRFVFYTFETIRLVGMVGDPAVLQLPEEVLEIDGDFLNVLAGKTNLETIVFHTKTVLTTKETIPDEWYFFSLFDICHLAVPRHLVGEYRSHPVWGWFKRIESIEDK